MSEMDASIAAASVTSRRMPSPALPNTLRYAAIDAAPSILVAVPITVTPARASACAIAMPIPRVAPVTSASFCSDMFDPLSFGRLERREDRVAVVEGQYLDARRDAPAQSAKHRSRAAFDDVRHA